MIGRNQQYDWESIKAEWEAGASMSSLARKHGVSVSRIHKLANRDGWVKGVNEPTVKRVKSERTIQSPVLNAEEGTQNDPDALTTRQEVFVAEYVKDLNASQAAIRSGLHPQSGRRLIGMPKIRKAISEIVNGLVADKLLVAERLIQEDLNRVFFDISNILDFGPGYAIVKPLAALPREASSCISKVREVRQKDGSTTVEVEVYNKDAAAERLYRTLGMFKDKMEHSVDDPLAVLMREIANRGRGLPTKGGGDAS